MDAPAKPPQSLMHPGMIVVGHDGALLGRVKTLREEDFLLDRQFAYDLYVPYDAIALIAGGAVALDVGRHTLDRMGWDEDPRLAA